MKINTVFFYVLGSMIVMGFFLTLLTSIVLVQGQDTINLMLGALIAAFSTVVGYFFGSSSSSAKKDETISNIATSSTNSPTTPQP